MAFLIFYTLVPDLGPTRALTVTFLVPHFAMPWGWLFLGEAVTASPLGGRALVAAGTIGQQRT